MVMLIPRCALADSNQQAQYAVGDVWQYKNRKGEDDSRVIIDKIESSTGKGAIYHISINHLKIPNPKNDTGFNDELPHAPVSLVTLQKSLTHRVAVKQPIDNAYLEGYKLWKDAYDTGKAGVFTIGIAEIVDVVEQATKQHQSK